MDSRNFFRGSTAKKLVQFFNDFTASVSHKIAVRCSEFAIILFGMLQNVSIPLPPGDKLRARAQVGKCGIKGFSARMSGFSFPRTSSLAPAEIAIQKKTSLS